MAAHDYEVIVCDKFGLAYGQILSAVPTQIEWELNGIGSANIEFWILDPTAIGLLPSSTLPGGREIQIWRDQVLIWWGWPISASFDKSQVHLQCSGLLWALAHRNFGPEIGDGIVNGSFELGVTDVSSSWYTTNPGVVWTLNDVTLGQPVLDGRYAAKLIGASNDDSGIDQGPAILELADTTEIDIAAWCYIDPNGGPFVPGDTNKGLRVKAILDGTPPTVLIQKEAFDPVQASHKVGEWVLHQVSLTLPAGTWLVYTILASLPQGWIVWDKATMREPQHVGGGISDLGGLIDSILSYAQNPAWGKSDLAMPTGGLPSRMVDRTYQLYDNGGILDALNEFPTAGYIDFEVLYGADVGDPTGHTRVFASFEPAKGSIKWNYPVEIAAGRVTDLSGSVDGSQVGTAQRALSQGTSAGAATDLGYAAFAGALGPGLSPGGSGYSSNRVSANDASYAAGSNVVNSATIGFSAADVGLPIHSLQGNIPVGAIIASVASSTQAAWTTPLSPFGTPGASRASSDDTISVGGTIVENSQSQVPNQNVGSLNPLATFTLARQRAAQVIPTPKMPADGPNGPFGNVVVGDVVPVNLQYGWLAGPTSLMRVAHLTLYPPTEELAYGLNVLNRAP